MKMTEEELDRLSEILDAFWQEFSILCNKYIEKAPSHLKSEYEMSLGEKTSIYGRMMSGIIDQVK